jgi:hypothetical protein
MTPAIVIVLIALAAAGGAAVFLALRSRRPVEEPLQHFKCPSCRRKLRYRRTQAGHKGMCPMCKQHLTFPTLPEKAASERKG